MPPGSLCLIIIGTEGLKEWRAVATRYEKTARSFIGVLCLAAVFDWIKKDFKL